MAYCTKTEVSSEFKDITFSSTTMVTADEVEDFIDQADAMIDASISNKYETPITGAISLLLLKYISILLVKGRILSILSVKTPQDKTKQDPDGPTLIQQAKDMLKDIKKGNLVLSDAVAINSQDGMSSYLMNETIAHDFKAGEDNW